MLTNKSKPIRSQIRLNGARRDAIFQGLRDQEEDKNKMEEELPKQEILGENLTSDPIQIVGSTVRKGTIRSESFRVLGKTRKAAALEESVLASFDSKLIKGICSISSEKMQGRINSHKRVGDHVTRLGWILREISNKSDPKSNPLVVTFNKKPLTYETHQSYLVSIFTHGRKQLNSAEVGDADGLPPPKRGYEMG